MYNIQYNVLYTVHISVHMAKPSNGTVYESRNKTIYVHPGFPRWLSVKESACNAGDSFNPWVAKTPRVGNGNPLQGSCLRNPKDRGARRATVHGVTKELDTTQCLNSNNSVSPCSSQSFPYRYTHKKEKATQTQHKRQLSNHRRREQKRKEREKNLKRIDICITNSLSCTPEANTTL